MKNSISLYILFLSGLLGSFCAGILLAIPSADIYLQSFFYNYSAGSWVVMKSNHVLFLSFYQLPKILISGIALVLLILLLLGSFKIKTISHRAKNNISAALTYLIILPLFIGFLKRVTQIPCPKDFKVFGGLVPDFMILESLARFHPPGGRCFPAGHASGGFALYGLMFLFLNSPKKMIFSFVATTLLGWTMGLYQIARGEHLFSHTFVTQILAIWLFFIIWKALEFLNAKST